MKRRSGGSQSVAMQGIVIICILANGFITWQLYSRLQSVEMRLGTNKPFLSDIRLPAFQPLKPNLSPWQKQLDIATQHAERARIALTKGNMGTAQGESERAMSALMKITSLPTDAAPTIKSLRLRILALREQVERSSTKGLDNK